MTAFSFNLSYFFNLTFSSSNGSLKTVLNNVLKTQVHWIYWEAILCHSLMLSPRPWFPPFLLQSFLSHCRLMNPPLSQAQSHAHMHHYLRNTCCSVKFPWTLQFSWLSESPDSTQSWLGYKFILLITLSNTTWDTRDFESLSRWKLLFQNLDRS